MNIVIEYLLLTAPLTTHIIVDLKGKVNHTLNACYVLGISIVLGFFLPGHFWQGALYALSIHFALFDPLYNLTHKKPFFYNGDARNPGRALSDKLWDKLPEYAQIFVRLWVLSIGYSVYYHLDRIVSYM